MGFLLEFGLVLVAVLLVATFGLRGLRGGGTSDRDSMTKRRVAAYIETIRRERSNPALVAMTDSELSDLLLSAAHNLKVETERKFYTIAIGGLLAVVAAIMAATQDGLRGFGITLVVGAVILYGLNEYLTRRIREPLIRQGIDVDRLRVE